MPTLEERVTRLEQRVDDEARLRAMLDRDLADFGERLRAQTGSIQAIAETQSEHTATLAVHTSVLTDHTSVLADHTSVLADHTSVLAAHTATLNRHTAMHKETAGVLAGLTLDAHSLKDSVEQIIGMLDTLIERGDRQ